MMEKVEKFCQQHGLLPQGAGILVACSGGADSLALLMLLWQLRERYQLRVVAAHYEHGIRGEESQEDAAFVQSFCQKLGIPFRLGSGDVPAYAEAYGLSLETAARKLRYAFLENIRQELSLDFLAVAHHADDQAETVLMRVFRGTGPAGLSAMRPKSGVDGHILRPLLGVTKQEIRQWCAKMHLTPREDSTNKQLDCTRNLLRLRTIPALQREYNPELSKALCQLAEVAAAESDYIRAQVDDLWKSPLVEEQDGVTLVVEHLAQLPLALQRGVVRKFWHCLTGSGSDLGFVQAEDVRRLCLENRTGSRLELPGGWLVRVAYGRLCGQPQASNAPAEKLPAVLLQIPGSTVWGRYTCEASWLATLPVSTGPFEYYFSPERLTEPLVIRQREAGDVIQLAGGRKKLKRLLIDDKIPQEERDRLPLIAAGHEILWVVGHRRSTLCPVDKDTTTKKKFLYLKIQRREEHLS
ncbi:MAG: tRNA lysidine(34) synthetase TilS [Selenomonas sp.]|uniref:tRNA lysidine(34) synthetase TilS n=1 Tax=Selenomonas sp. TaxID=2053611 RepID=UPI0025F497A8|nr:tRNA lysidine(34) synthetase TilS [Selenomonas sp.]MCR5438994.1 tRNA lysidine(34) synthetase TilS [Selenomonas sp.]